MTVYEIVTAHILTHLAQGTIPWRQPWQAGELPKNLFSQQPYHGVNVWLLATQPYSSPFWLTRRQAEQIGGQIRAGERGTPVVFWKQYTPRSAAMAEQPEDEPSATRRMLRYYLVWNTEQCALPPSLTARLALARPAEPEPLAACERVVEQMPDRPAFVSPAPKAYYVPATDTIHLPARARFLSIEEYYATVFHELAHSTGLGRRLGRASLLAAMDGSHDAYGREELVAELGAAYLCGQCQIGPATVANAAAYIQGWLRVLRSDTRLVIGAAAEAQKAVAYILNEERTA